MIIRFVIFLAVVLLVEFYFLQAVRTFVQDFSQGKKHIIIWTAYVFTGISILFALIVFVYPPGKWNTFMRFAFSIVFIIVLCKLFAFVILFLEDITRFFRWIFSLFKGNSAETVASGQGISRLKF